MDADVINEVRKALGKPEVIEIGDEHAFVMLPAGYTVQDVRNLRPPPARVQQKVELLTVESFAAYVREFATNSTAVFGDERTGAYRAIIDYHTGTGGGFSAGRGPRDHVASYSCPKSDQWTAWNSNSGKFLSQVDFAQFLQTNLRDIQKPAAADMLQVALELQVHKDAAFESEIRLDNGQARFRYSETVRGTTKAGDLQIPSSFVIAIPVFFGGAVHAVEALFKYRMTEGTLVIGYELVRPLDVYRAAIAQVTADMRERLPNVRFYVGAPSAA